MTSICSFQATSIDGHNVSMKDYKGIVSLIVNTASKCGFTPQYEGLQKLHDTYHVRGFTVLGFPCNQFGGQEPGPEEEIKQFCSLHYNVTFPLFQKVDVNGENAHPLFKYLRDQAPEDIGLDPNSRLHQILQEKMPQLLEGSNIRWNFTKFLIDQEGNVVKRYAPTADLEMIEQDIQKLLR